MTTDGNVESVNPYGELPSGSVATVLLCQNIAPFGDWELRPITDPITVPDKINQLLSPLQKERLGNHPWSFSGVLCYQVFLDRNGAVLFATHIVSAERVILFDVVEKRSERYFLSKDAHNSFDNMQNMKSEEFFRVVRSLLPQNYRPEMK